MSEQQRPPTEEELRAAYEAELKRVRVDDVLVQTVVSLVNLAGRKAGLAPGTEDERDLDQVHQAIEAVRALLPLVEESLGPDAARVRDALSQLQMAYAQARASGEEQPAEAAGQEPPTPEGPGRAQSSGRLWVPGQ
jgi:hypothetical protein